MIELRTKKVHKLQYEGNLFFKICFKKIIDELQL